MPCSAGPIIGTVLNKNLNEEKDRKVRSNELIKERLKLHVHCEGS